MELIKQEIETYALVFPGVAFSLENTNAVRNSGPVLKVPKVGLLSLQLDILFSLIKGRRRRHRRSVRSGICLARHWSRYVLPSS